MYKTYYIILDNFDSDYYDLKAMITKAENIKDAMIKFKRRLERNYYIKPIIKEYQIQELNKTEIIIIDY